MLRATFVMEQHIGHRAFSQNLRRFVEVTPHLDSHWVEVTYTEGSIWGGVSFLPSHIRGMLNGRSQVQEGLCQTPYDVAFFNTQAPAVLGGSVAGQQPYVLCTDITPIQYDQMAEHYNHTPDGNGIISRFKHWANVRLMRNAAKIVPWSTWVRQSLIEDYGVKAEHIEVVPPGVDTDVWTPSSESKMDGPLRILFVGGDLYRKGGQLLLDAFQNLPEGQAELHLVTRTPLPPSKNVKVYHNMQPNSPELIALYRSSHVFVLPTHAEAFGIAAVEASAMGLPVIATAIGGLTDIVVDEMTGFLIQPGDDAALASRLYQLTTHPQLRSRLGMAARQRVEEHFDARKNAERIMDIIHDAAVGKPRLALQKAGER